MTDHFKDTGGKISKREHAYDRRNLEHYWNNT